MILFVLLLAFLDLSSATSSLISLELTRSNAGIRPCREEPGLISCIVASIDLAHLQTNYLTLPGFEIVLEKRKYWSEEGTNFFLFGNDAARSQAFFSQRQKRMMGTVNLPGNNIFLLEPCNNWEGCHVWKQIDSSVFSDNAADAMEINTENELSKEDQKTLDYLLKRGKEDQETLVEYSIIFYYTVEFAEVTDDIELFVDTVIADMNQGYNNSNIPVRAKKHCVKRSSLNDLETSSDTLHAFSNYKDSEEELRETADAAQLLAFNFKNCGSGYTYEATSGYGRTLTTVKKSCSYSYHSSGHEVGHNFGCQHNVEDGENTHYEYGQGYFIGPENLGDTGFRTCMAYNADGHKTRLNQFSNPLVYFDYDNEEYVTGNFDVADNSRVIAENRFAMAEIGDESQECDCITDCSFLTEGSYGEGCCTNNFCVCQNGLGTQIVCPDGMVFSKSIGYCVSKMECCFTEECCQP